MPAKVNHVAIASDQYALNGKFYEALFGMKPSSKPRPAALRCAGRWLFGLNCIPRRDGRYSGLDHFGIEVEDLDEPIAAIGKFDSSLSALKRPPIRPYAAYSAHDPDTNIFDRRRRTSAFKKTSMPKTMARNKRARTSRTSRCARGTRTLRRILYGGVRLKPAERLGMRISISRWAHDPDDHSVEDFGLLRARTPRCTVARLNIGLQASWKVYRVT